ncbi:hypothetical protein ACFL1I_02620 [Candidatus Omnitrophota bacterium]
MLAKILGTLWIILGLLWLIKPEMLKRRLIKKTNRKIKWAVYGFTLMLVFSLLGVVFKAQGAWLKVIGLIGIFALVRIILQFSGRTSQKIAEWGSKQSLLIFRIWALIILITGICLILTAKNAFAEQKVKPKLAEGRVKKLTCELVLSQLDEASYLEKDIFYTVDFRKLNSLEALKNLKVGDTVKIEYLRQDGENFPRQLTVTKSKTPVERTTVLSGPGKGLDPVFPNQYSYEQGPLAYEGYPEPARHGYVTDPELEAYEDKDEHSF